jgi:hypothetical protein
MECYSHLIAEDRDRLAVLKAEGRSVGGSHRPRGGRPPRSAGNRGASREWRAGAGEPVGNRTVFDGFYAVVGMSAVALQRALQLGRIRRRQAGAA